MSNTQANILIVDDESNIRFFLRRVLSREGYRVTSVATGEEALARIRKEDFDLALLDLRLPGIGGLDVLSTLHESAPNTAVIVLTGYASLDTAVEALRHGAYDYLLKPAKTVELRGSVRTALRKRQVAMRRRELIDRLEQNLAVSLEEIRNTVVDTTAQAAGEAGQSADEGRFLKRGIWFVDFTRHIITLQGQLLELTPTEFDLLAYMIGEAPRVIPHQELLTEVQGYETDDWEANDTVRYHIYNLRSKIKEADVDAQVIRTVRGIGYAVETEGIM